MHGSKKIEDKLQKNKHPLKCEYLEDLQNAQRKKYVFTNGVRNADLRHLFSNEDLGSKRKFADRHGNGDYLSYISKQLVDNERGKGLFADRPFLKSILVTPSTFRQHQASGSDTYRINNVPAKATKYLTHDDFKIDSKLCRAHLGSNCKSLGLKKYFEKYSTPKTYRIPNEDKKGKKHAFDKIFMLYKKSPEKSDNDYLCDKGKKISQEARNSFLCYTALAPLYTGKKDEIRFRNFIDEKHVGFIENKEISAKRSQSEPGGWPPNRLKRGRLKINPERGRIIAARGDRTLLYFENNKMKSYGNLQTGETLQRLQKMAKPKLDLHRELIKSELSKTKPFKLIAEPKKKPLTLKNEGKKVYQTLHLKVPVQNLPFSNNQGHQSQYLQHPNVLKRYYDLQEAQKDEYPPRNEKKNDASVQTSCWRSEQNKKKPLTFERSNIDQDLKYSDLESLMMKLSGALKESSSIFDSYDRRRKHEFKKKSFEDRTEFQRFNRSQTRDHENAELLKEVFKNPFRKDFKKRVVNSFKKEKIRDRPRKFVILLPAEEQVPLHQFVKVKNFTFDDDDDDEDEFGVSGPGSRSRKKVKKTSLTDGDSWSQNTEEQLKSGSEMKRFKCCDDCKILEQKFLKLQYDFEEIQKQLREPHTPTSSRVVQPVDSASSRVPFKSFFSKFMPKTKLESGCSSRSTCKGPCRKGYCSEPESVVHLEEKKNTPDLRPNTSEPNVNLTFEILMENFDPETGRMLDSEVDHDFEQEGNIRCNLITPEGKSVECINTNFSYNPRTGMLFKNGVQGNNCTSKEISLPISSTYNLFTKNQWPFKTTRARIGEPKLLELFKKQERCHSCREQELLMQRQEDLMEKLSEELTRMSRTMLYDEEINKATLQELKKVSFELGNEFVSHINDYRGIRSNVQRKKSVDAVESPILRSLWQRPGQAFSSDFENLEQSSTSNLIPFLKEDSENTGFAETMKKEEKRDSSSFQYEAQFEQDLNAEPNLDPKKLVEDIEKQKKINLAMAELCFYLSSKQDDM